MLQNTSMHTLTARRFALLLGAFLSVHCAPSLLAQNGDVVAEPASPGNTSPDLAQDLTNPVADLITLPIQANFDQNLGPVDDGVRLQTNIQPVMPFALSDDWNLLSRTIMPVIHQKDIFPGAGTQFGLGDISQTLFLSPREPTGGVTWGAGPVFLLPTATDDLLGGKKWGAGPSLVALTLQGPWTVGVLGNHIWSFAGEGDRAEINNTFVQPVSLQTGVGYWAESPDVGAAGFRFRLQVNIVLPK